MLNRLWFAPLLSGAVVLGLLGILLLPSSTTIFGGWSLIAAAVAFISGGIWSRRRDPKPGARSWTPWLATVLLLVIVIVGFRQANIMLLDAGMRTSGNIERIAQGEVAAQMRDPQSAVFTDLKTNGAVVCGRVNGRNGFGAYAGAKRFVWQEGSGPQIESSFGLSGYPEADRMKQCFFERDWTRCQTGDARPAIDCSTSHVDVR